MSYDINFSCVRENKKDEHLDVGGRLHNNNVNKVAIQNGVFTRSGVERVIRYSFDLTMKRG
jgi:tartrate dehydrogenase/decarboxylase / D-malate dehydrogenase